MTIVPRAHLVFLYVSIAVLLLRCSESDVSKGLVSAGCLVLAAAVAVGAVIQIVQLARHR